MSGIQKFRDGGGRIDLHLHTTNSDGDNTRMRYSDWLHRRASGSFP